MGNQLCGYRRTSGRCKVKPLIHADNSVKKWKGTVEDYLPIHDFLDSSKAHFPDMRHRALLHNSFGIYIAERIFGTYITNSDGHRISVRDIAEHHVIEDMGTIPTVQDYLQHLPMLDWLGGKPREKRHISWDSFDNQHKGAQEFPASATGGKGLPAAL